MMKKLTTTPPPPAVRWPDAPAPSKRFSDHFGVAVALVAAQLATSGV
jgi:hypothetical protein